MVRIVPALLVPAALLLAPAAGHAAAATFDGRPKLLLHLTATTSKSACQAGNPGPCSAVVTQGTVAPSGAGPHYFAYLLAARGSLAGVSEFQVGIEYENDAAGDYLNGRGVDILGWTLCATSQVFSGPNVWPQPRSGNLIQWDAPHCPSSETAVAGYFYVTALSPDAMILKPRPQDGVTRVVDCAGAPFPLLQEDLGFARFTAAGTQAGCNPCLASCVPPDAVQGATWGGLKALFGR